MLLKLLYKNEIGGRNDLVEKTKGISFKVVLAIIIAVIVILAIIFVVSKNKSNETNDRLENRQRVSYGIVLRILRSELQQKLKEDGILNK